MASPEKLEHIKHALESRRQLRQATMNFEHAGLKVLLLLNGGGLIAFLTFLGTDAANNLRESSYTVTTLIFWLIGLVLAGGATGFAYYSQYYFFKSHGEVQRVKIRLDEYPDKNQGDDETILALADKYDRFAQTDRWWAEYFAIFSFAAFGLGAFFSLIGLAVARVT